MPSRPTRWPAFDSTLAIRQLVVVLPLVPVTPMSFSGEARVAGQGLADAAERRADVGHDAHRHVGRRRRMLAQQGGRPARHGLGHELVAVAAAARQGGEQTRRARPAASRTCSWPRGYRRRRGTWPRAAGLSDSAADQRQIRFARPEASMPQGFRPRTGRGSRRAAGRWTGRRWRSKRGGLSHFSRLSRRVYWGTTLRVVILRSVPGNHDAERRATLDKRRQMVDITGYALHRF